MPPITAVLRRIEPGALLARVDMRLNGLLFGVILAYALVVQWVGMSAGLQGNINYYLYSESSETAAGLSFVIFMIGYVLHLAAVRRVPRPLRVIRDDALRLLRDPVVVFNIAFPLLALPVFMSSFTSFKSMIPELKPFAYDPLLSALDRSLHGGFAPWELTHALFGGPMATAAINAAYNLWFFIMWVFLFLQVVRVGNPRERIQFIVAYMLCWAVIGSLFAYLLSSAGPCYFGRVVVGMADPYAPLMARLQAIHQEFEATGSYFGVWALGTQNLLWDLAMKSETHIGSGISAMPSMHVAIATLMALAAFRIRRWLGWVMVGYAAIIQIGSVHLGWHYALDGYLSVLLTILLWRLAGWMVARAAGPATGNGNA